MVDHRSHFKPCVLRFRKGGTEHFFVFVLGLQRPVVTGLVQLRRDELLSDIDAAIDLHSGEAKDWAQKFHVVDGVWVLDAWCLWTRRIASDKVVLTDLCIKWLASWQQWRVVRLVAGRCLALADIFE